jgi:hypothetical protein
LVTGKKDDKKFNKIMDSFEFCNSGNPYDTKNDVRRYFDPEALTLEFKKKLNSENMKDALAETDGENGCMKISTRKYNFIMGEERARDSQKQCFIKEATEFSEFRECAEKPAPFSAIIEQRESEKKGLFKV